MAFQDTYREEHDCLYGTIRLHGVLSNIIATSEFQRLKKIKQLGGVDYVFKDATHTRYQHSIGTAYLAGKLARHLQMMQKLNLEYCKEMKINERDILCVELAALCHDLGHGPFSHVFQNKFLPRFDKVSNHKHRSFIIFQEIWKRIVGSEDPLSTDDMLFIQEMIEGGTKDQPYRGRKPSKWFLYQILSDENCVVDVCKFDYVTRDCLYLGFIAEEKEKVNISLLDQVQFVKKENGEYQLSCVTEYDSQKLLNSLHSKAYQHRDVNAVEHMICDALVFDDDSLGLSTSVDNNASILSTFCKTDDDVLMRITSRDAGHVICRIKNQDYYPCIAEMIIKVDGSVETIKQQILSQFKPLREDPRIRENLIRVSVLNYQLKQRDGLPRTDFKVAQVFCVNPNYQADMEQACKVAQTILSDFVTLAEVSKVLIENCSEVAKFHGSM